jgi:hypothetical protein
MMIKKMLLLGAMALAAVAFAVPATASAADEWTDNHVPLQEGQTANQSFEGFLSFNAGPNGTFGCDVTVEIEAEGGSHATIKKFNPTTSTCKGTGPAFTNCELIADKSNVLSAGWDLSFTTTTAGAGTLTATTGDLTIHNEYAGCTSGLPTSHLEFKSIAVTPTLDSKDTITGIHIGGVATTGPVASGTVVPEPADARTLGLTTTP